MPAVPIPDFYPERLNEAVKSRAMTWKALAETAGVKTSTLSEYKQGKTTPSPDQLSKLAVALEYPESYFVRPAIIGSILAGPRLFRCKAAVAKRAAEQAESRLSLLSESLVFAEKLLHLPEPTFLKAYEQITDPLLLGPPEIEAIALSVREKLGFGLKPITNLVRTLERSGVGILRYETEKKVGIDGLSQHSVVGRPLCAIFASETSSMSREYFSIAHELGHIVLHARIKESRFDDLAGGKLVEDQANRFASAFLLPAQPFLAALAAPTLSYFEFLKREWRASIQAMMRRCLDLGKIDRNEFSHLYVRLSQKRWRTREPLDDQFEIEKPALLKQAFTILADRERIGGARIAKELHRNPTDLAAVSGLPGSFFTESSPDENVVAFPNN